MRIDFIVHESFETPGAYASWAQSRGNAISYSKVYLGEALRESANEIDFFIIMGVPQSPATTKAECPHFDAAAEISLIANRVAANRTVIGTCLGSHLLAKRWAPDSTIARKRRSQVPDFSIMRWARQRKVCPFW
jgi:GMP synthase (glutamine-hydrolysing)